MTVRIDRWLAGIGVTQCVAPPFAIDARREMRHALRDAATLNDGMLLRPWAFRSGSLPARYGFYHLGEIAEDAIASLERRAAPATVLGSLVGASVAARWSLVGRLLVVPPDLIDRDPGGGEWSIRRTLAHVVSTQARYTLSTVYAIERVLRAGGPVELAAERQPSRDGDAAAADGEIETVIARLEEYTDAGATYLLDVSAKDALAAPTVWASIPVDARYRVVRWASHYREHAIQIDKTLTLLGWAPREVDRILLQACDACGRLEGAAFGSSARLVAAEPILTGVAAEYGRIVAELRAVA